MLKSMNLEEPKKLLRMQTVSSREPKMTIQDSWLNASLFNVTSMANSPRRLTFRDKLMARMLETETWLPKCSKERIDSEIQMTSLWSPEKNKTTLDFLTITSWREMATWSLKLMPCNLTAMSSGDRIEISMVSWRDLFRLMSRSELLSIEEIECKI